MAHVHTAYVETSECPHVGMFKIQSCARVYQMNVWTLSVERERTYHNYHFVKQIVRLHQQLNDID